jgi:hypothetical protein
MSLQSPRRAFVIAVLLTLLAAPALMAQPLAVPSLDHWLNRLWTYVDGLFEKEGASLDPSGSNPAPTPPASGGQGEAGMTIDPDGANVAPGVGVIANPNG